MSAGEHTQLLFHHGNRERRIFGNVTGKLISNRLKFLNGHQVIDDAETFGSSAAIGRAVKTISFTIQRTCVEKGQHARHIIGHAEPGGRHGKSSARRRNDEVAGKGHLASSALPISAMLPVCASHRLRRPVPHKG